MKNYVIGHAEGLRSEFREQLGLMGAEASVNILSAGGCVPFVHSHKENEEIYVIIAGKGTLKIDGRVVEVKNGDVIKIASQRKRQFMASEDTALSYVRIQVKTGSLTKYTQTDAVIA